jgi:hypothetical protein
MGRMTQFYQTVVAKDLGATAVVDNGSGLCTSFHHDGAARLTARAHGLPGFWRLKERKA